MSVEIPIEQLIESPYNVRRRPERGLEDLIASIREVGIINPLLVRPSPTHEGKYEVVCGNRRLMAARSLGMKKVPCIVREDIDDKECILLSLNENMKRGDLTEDEISSAIHRLYEEFNMPPDDIAKFLNLSVDVIRRFLKLYHTVEVARKLGKEPEERAGRLAEEDRKTKIPSSVLDIARRLCDRIVQKTGLKHLEERIRSVIVEEFMDLPQRSATAVYSMVKKEIPWRVEEEPERVEEVIREVLRRAKELVKDKKNLSVMVSSKYTAWIDELSRKLDVSRDVVVDIALSIAMEHEDRVIKRAKEILERIPRKISIKR